MRSPSSILAVFMLSALALGACAKKESAAPAPKDAAPVAAEGKAPPAGAVKVRMETTLGAFTLELDPQKAPKTVANFLQYVDDGFYVGTLFHRVIPGFMVQGGGFTTELTPKETRAPIENEGANGLKNVTGSISMARTSAPNSATSQFFINVVDNASLDASGGRAGYAVFGRVIEGMDIVQRIAVVPRGNRNGMGDVPLEPVTITGVRRIE